MIRVTFVDEESVYREIIEVSKEKLKSDPMERIRFNCMISHEAGKLFGLLREELKEEKEK